MEMFLQADTWLALLTLCFLEIVLGIDNIIFISIVSNKLPEEHRKQARNTGLALAMIVRICFLLGITWIIKFTEPLFTVFGQSFSGKDLILLFGGLFLIAKSTMEINHEMEGDGDDDDDDDEEGSDGAEKREKKKKKKAHPSLRYTIVQIILLDIIFSFDSILTAVGIVPPEQVIIMIIAVIVSIIVMMFFSGQISNFIKDHPSMEVLALGFLILIGFTLFLEALHQEIPKGYIYFAVFFSLVIEFTNIRVKKRRKAKAKVVKLNKSYSESEATAALKQFAEK
jgi:predicted tellurium resistance membrane protein TerC